MKATPFALAALVLGSLGIAFFSATSNRGALIGFADVSARVLFWGFLFLASARLAARALRSPLTGLAHVAWDGAAGLVLLMTVLLFVGLAPGGFRVVIVRLVVAGFFVAGAVAGVFDRTVRFGGKEPTDAGTRRTLLLLLGIAIIGLAWDRVPPVFFDARAYHFALPELWLTNGRVAPVPWSVFSWFPPGMSMLYSVGLATGGESWANDANLLVGLCLLSACFDVARRLFGPSAGVLASVLLLAMPLVLYALAIPGADLGHGLFAFGALASLVLHRGGDPSWIRRAGLLAAGAVLTKYLGLLAPLGVGVLWLAATRTNRIGNVLRFAAPAALLLLPWLAANALAVGNPVAPTASRLLPVQGFAPGAETVFRGDTRGGIPGVADFRALPGRWIVGDESESRFYPTPAWGWLPVLLLVPALLACRDDRSVRALLAVTLVLLAVWLLTFRWERFLVAPAALLSVAFAGGVYASARWRASLRLLPALAVVAAALSILPTCIRIGQFNRGIRVALGLESASDFIERGLPSVRLFRYANDTLDPRIDCILFVGDMRHYGLSIPRIAPPGFNVHPLVTALGDDRNPEVVTRRLRDQGVTHLLTDPGWVARSAAHYPSLAELEKHPEYLRDYLATLGSPIAAEGQVALYKLPL